MQYCNKCKFKVNEHHTIIHSWRRINKRNYIVKSNKMLPQKLKFTACNYLRTYTCTCVFRQMSKLRSTRDYRSRRNWIRSHNYKKYIKVAISRFKLVLVFDSTFNYKFGFTLEEAIIVAKLDCLLGQPINEVWRLNTAQS